ncbi:MAG: hypothetical protein IGS16_17680, partial [Thermoleptolyngbya sp. C42_A2020_037]
MKNALTTWSTAIASAGIAVLMAAVNPANAASITFSASQQQGSAPVNVDIFAQDVADGVEFSLKVNDPKNIGDLLAIYFNFGGLFDTNIPKTTTVTGQDVTKVALNTNNIVGGNIGQRFEMAIQFGRTGAAGGLLTETTFKIAQVGLTVQDFLHQTFAVRLQAVGSGVNGGTNSAKQYGTAPVAVDPVKVIEPIKLPEPEVKAPEPEVKAPEPEVKAPEPE